MSLCPKCAKKCAMLNLVKTTLSAGSQGKFQTKECVSGYQSVPGWQSVTTTFSRPDRAQEPCPAFPSLFQPFPASSRWIQPGQGPGDLPSCPEVQEKCPVKPSVQGTSQESHINHIGFLLPVNHVCLHIALPVSHLGFSVSYYFNNFNLKWDWEF